MQPVTRDRERGNRAAETLPQIAAKNKKNPARVSQVLSNCKFKGRGSRWYQRKGEIRRILGESEAWR